jgi:hypothetical protein
MDKGRLLRWMMRGAKRVKRSGWMLNETDERSPAGREMPFQLVSGSESARATILYVRLLTLDCVVPC